MQSISCQASFVDMPCFNDVEKLVNENLLRDWIIRIQHTSEITPYDTHWQQWGGTLFALKDASIVISNIIACRERFPDHAVRVYAEKYNPDTRFTYWVYRINDESNSMTRLQAPPMITNVRKQAWFADITEKVRVTRTRIWHIASLIGILITSVFVIEANTV